MTEITLAQLARDPHPIHARLRSTAPISWVAALGGWLVTSRELAVTIMRNDRGFTVDHPGFTTAQVVGPSMLSLDGDEHVRHRDPFRGAFRVADVRQRFSAFLVCAAERHVAAIEPAGRAELRRELAAPFAVEVVAELLGMLDVDPVELLALYRQIVGAVEALSAGEGMPAAGPEAVSVMRELVGRAQSAGGNMLAEAAEQLGADEVVSNAAVMLFGGIETNEGMTASALWYLLWEPGLIDTISADRAQLAGVVEESLRLEPAAARVDRYATADTVVAGAEIKKDDLVIVSLAAANRDPLEFAEPDTFDVTRSDAPSHVTFAQGPHTCIGQHLARMETLAMVGAVLDGLPGIRMNHAESIGHRGLVFRKPEALVAEWPMD